MQKKFAFPQKIIRCRKHNLPIGTLGFMGFYDALNNYEY